MRTRLSAVCEAVIEAGWLVALLVVPLFFNVYSQRVFEPDKISLVRSIATIMAAMWAVWLVERLVTAGSRDKSHRKGWWACLRETPLVLPALLLLGAYLLSTALSVTPHVSFWGSYERLQGTYSLLSYVVIGLSVLFLLRRRQQVERLLVVIILTSVPVSLYGIVQHYGLDPLPWGGDVTERVAGSLGNAIFIAAYLIMVVPLTVVQWLRVWRRETEGWATARRLRVILVLALLLIVQAFLWGAVGLAAGLWFSLVVWGSVGTLGWLTGGSVRRWIVLGLYQTVLAGQMVCIVFTQSRGPWLGLAAGLFLFLVVALIASRRHRIALGLGAGALVVGVFLGVLNMPAGPLAPLRDLPYLGRLGRIFEVESGTGRVRVLIWQGALEMITDDPMRTIVGYGPESMYVAFSPYYAPELGHLERRSASPDRSHNETYDALITTGVLGLAAYMYLFWSLYRLAMRSLGLVQDRRDQRLFLALTLGAGLLGLALPYFIERQWRYVGITMPLAMTAGVGAYALVKAAHGGRISSRAMEGSSGSEANPVSRPETSLMVAGLLGAIVAHFVEIHFGIAIGATRTYFWVLAAMLVVLGEGWVAWDEPAVVLAETARVPQRRRARSRQPRAMTAERFAMIHAMALGLMGAAILGTLVWDYAANAMGRTSVVAVLWESLTTMQAQGRPDVRSFSIAAVVGFTWVALGLLVAGLEMPELEAINGRHRLRAGLASMGVSAVGAGLYALVHAARLCPPVDVMALLTFYVGFMAMIGVLAVSALALCGGWPPAGRRAGMGLLGVLIVLIALPLADRYNLRPIRADMVFKQGMRFEDEGAFTTALSFYRQAATLAPQEDRYWLYQGRMALEQARVESDASNRQHYLNLAQEVLQKAHSLSPLNTDHVANLARLHRMWGELETDEASRRAHWERSVSYYSEAHALSPNSAQLLNEWGIALLLLDDREAAMDKFEQSLALDSAYAQTYALLGDLYGREEDWGAAIAAYERALALDDSLLQVWSSLGYAASQTGDWAAALDANLAVYQRAPTDYNTIKNLAIIYAQLDEPDEAMRYARDALEMAPESERVAWEQFIRELESGAAHEGGR